MNPVEVFGSDQRRIRDTLQWWKVVDTVLGGGCGVVIRHLTVIRHGQLCQDSFIIG